MLTMGGVKYYFIHPQRFDYVIPCGRVKRN
jgi:hypothetical protein